MKYLVTRHAGAKAWIEGQGIVIDELIEHLEISTLQPGDSVIGTLPIHIVAQLTDNAVHYFHLTLNLPAQARGKELSAAQLNQYGACLQEYQATQID